MHKIVQSDHDKRLLYMSTIGSLLYGERWKAAIASDLGVSRSLIVQQCCGRRSITPAQIDKIKAIAERRINMLKLSLEIGVV